MNRSEVLTGGPTVVQLIVGSSEESEAEWSRASGSVALIRDADVICVVDCGSPWDGRLLTRSTEYSQNRLT